MSGSRVPYDWEILTLGEYPRKAYEDDQYNSKIELYLWNKMEIKVGNHTLKILPYTNDDEHYNFDTIFSYIRRKSKFISNNLCDIEYIKIYPQYEDEQERIGEFYFKEGKLHNLNGYAVIEPWGTKHLFIKGKKIDIDLFRRYQRKLKLERIKE